MDDSFVALINDAVSNQQWILLALAIVLLIVPIVLRALGKQIPIVDQLVPVITGFLKGLLKKPEPKPAELPENQPGVASVVNIEDARKDKGPQP